MTITGAITTPGIPLAAGSPSPSASGVAAATAAAAAPVFLEMRHRPSSNFYEFKHTVQWNGQDYNVRAMIPIAADNAFLKEAQTALQASLEIYINDFVAAKQTELNAQTAGKAFTLSVNTVNYTVAVPPRTIYTSNASEQETRVNALWNIIKTHTGFAPSQMTPTAEPVRPAPPPYIPAHPISASLSSRSDSEDSSTSHTFISKASAVHAATIAGAARSTVSYEGRTYRICNTSGDGDACALHALLGVQSRGTYQYRKGGIAAKKAYAHKLTLRAYQGIKSLQTHLQETVRATARNLDSISNHPIMRHINHNKMGALINQLNQLEHQHEKLQAQRNTLCQQLRLIADPSEQSAIIAQVSGTTRDWNEFIGKHDTDYSFKLISRGLNNTSLGEQLTEWTTANEALTRVKQQAIENFVQSQEMRKAYLKACIDPSYQFADQELAAAAHLFGYRLVLCREDTQRVFNETSSQVRVIYQAPGHYSRCEPLEPRTLL